MSCRVDLSALLKTLLGDENIFEIIVNRIKRRAKLARFYSMVPYIAVRDIKNAINAGFTPSVCGSGCSNKRGGRSGSENTCCLVPAWKLGSCVTSGGAFSSKEAAVVITSIGAHALNKKMLKSWINEVLPALTNGEYGVDAALDWIENNLTSCPNEEKNVLKEEKNALKSAVLALLYF